MTYTDPVHYIVADARTARILHHDSHGMHTVETLEAGTEADAAARFAATIASRLNQVGEGTVPGRYVLAAPAHLLHDIRARLDKDALDRLLADVPRDLAHLPDHALIEHFDIPATGWPAKT
ncbi:AtsE protein [Gluconacetobacter diazotrophicus PA1 5]|nr:host attachment protein [Gluconacetobacter diazotrophicus]ACI51152.1 AtsE protein [Gluconacetobacter diazotrophicus PA1 5]TWB07571.1 protein required for attachment to host cells [Gluconacetobacter diazotrophicus]